ncbi:hypothetical protein FOZ60_007483 [Perkinsus olseni]|uniref:Uncharacterized protein n=1 Tax=Perkinsus olseni TaxID=32597 RepID=A0A7J6PMQ1_PEROL|nr:hypothetical protein FOZ60_007483 [Perkinsus olseni]
MSCSSCCCLPLKGGMVVSATSLAVITITNCSIITHFYLHEAVQYIPWLRDELLYWNPILTWSFSLMTVMVGMAALAMSTGTGKLPLSRLYVSMLFLSGILWITYGIHFGFKVRSFYAQLLPGNYLIMKSGQAEQHQTAKMGAAMVAAAFTNPLVESMAYPTACPRTPPTPCLFQLGRAALPHRHHFLLRPSSSSHHCSLRRHSPHPVPLQLTLYAISYANVVEAGGDGTEFCRAEDIPWFYSLSPTDQEKVRNGEMSDDSEDDEEDRNRYYHPNMAVGQNADGTSAMRRRPQ